MKQDRLTKHTKTRANVRSVKPKPKEKTSTRLMDIDLSEFKTNPLWPILVDTAKKNPLYPGLVGYYRDKILPNDPNISPKKLADKLRISLGEALVILDADRNE